MWSTVLLKNSICVHQICFPEDWSENARNVLHAAKVTETFPHQVTVRWRKCK